MLEEAKRLSAESDQLYREGQYAAALPLAQRALALWEQALGPTHLEVATSLNAVARLYHAQGQYAEAAPLYRRTLAIREQTLAPTHPSVATSLDNLGVLYYAQGQYAEAATLYQRALAIREQALGPMHPFVATSLNNLAMLASAQGDHARAISLLTRSGAIHEHTLTLMLTLGTEAQKLASAVMFSPDTNLIVSFHTRSSPHDPQALRLALTTVLRRKGRVLEAITDMLAALRRQVVSDDQQLLAQWAAARGDLATLVFAGLGAHAPDAYRTRLTQMEAQAQQLDAQLSARSAAFRTAMQPVTLAQVQAALPTGTALVEFAVYTPFTPPQHWGTARYIAYILHPQGPPAWVDLGEAAPIDHAVEQFRADLRGPHRLRVRATARAVDELMLRPLRPLLEH